MHVINPGPFRRVFEEPGIRFAAGRVKQFKVLTQRKQPVCQRYHRGDADATTQQQRFGGALFQFEMVDRFGDKDPLSHDIFRWRLRGS